MLLADFISPPLSGSADLPALLASGATSAGQGLLWLSIGLGAQAIIAACIVVQWLMCRRRKSFVIPPWLCYFCAFATVLLLVYAAVRHDLVFVIGQLLNTFICVRLVAMIQIRRGIKAQQDKNLADTGSGFPVVSPDSAEWKLPRRDLSSKTSASGDSSSGLSPRGDRNESE